jgi:hypothetical protein
MRRRSAFSAQYGRGRIRGITKPELAMTLASSGFVVLGYYDR